MATLLLLAAPLRAAEPATRPADAARQYAEVEKLLAQYRRADTSVEQKRELVAQLLDLGTGGPQQLMVVVQRDLLAKGPAYLARFERSAGDALRARRKGQADVDSQIAQLRKTVLEVSHTADLTKDLIVSKADPAMAQLEQWLAVKPDDVFAQTPDLKAQRQELLDLLGLWHQALARLPETLRKRPNPLPEPAAYDKELAGKEEQAAALATPMTQADRAALVANVPLAKALDPEEARGVLLLNQMRIRLGIGALVIDPKLVEAARGHCRDMQERKFFAHDSPVAGKETPWKRAEAAGTTASAENIFMGISTGKAAIEGWWHSPGHHKNMVGGATRVGLGRSGTYWTQMFGR